MNQIEFAGEDFSQLAVRGGVIVVSIDWHCNLDWDFMEFCRPVYGFRRYNGSMCNFFCRSYSSLSESSSINLLPERMIPTQK